MKSSCAGRDIKTKDRLPALESSYSVIPKGDNKKALKFTP
nr:MAG TPA: hypothetical protein [Caudoviricetes sp.]